MKKVSLYNVFLGTLIGLVGLTSSVIFNPQLQNNVRINYKCVVENIGEEVNRYGFDIKAKDLEFLVKTVYPIHSFGFGFDGGDVVVSDAAGSGVVVNDYVLTAAHVIASDFGTDLIPSRSVLMHDKDARGYDLLEAKLVNVGNDYAVLKPQDGYLPIMVEHFRGDWVSDYVKGDKVLLIGNGRNEGVQIRTGYVVDSDDLHVYMNTPVMGGYSGGAV